mgnify:CR=1 FL=1
MTCPFFRNFSHFSQLTQPLQSVNTATSVSQRSRFIQSTQPLLSANSVTSVCQLSHIILSTQPLHSANAATSFYQIKYLIRATNTPLDAHVVESSSQRSNILNPVLSDLDTSAAVCSNSMKRKNSRNEVHGFISLLQRPNLLKEKLFFSNLIPLIPRLDLTI